MLKEPGNKDTKGRAAAYLGLHLAKFEDLETNTMIAKGFFKYLGRIINTSLLKQNSHDIF